MKAIEAVAAEKGIAPSLINVEAAASRDEDPEKFVQGARSMVPADIIRAIRECGGIDTFLDNVAQLEGSSPLNTQAGRNFIRSVYEKLVKSV